MNPETPKTRSFEPPMKATVPLTPPRRQKWLIIGIAVAIIVLGGVSWAVYGRSSGTAATKRTTATKIVKTTPPAVEPHANRIELIATGDFIAHDSVNTAAKQADGSYNYSPLINDFVPVFKQANIKFCNDPILNGGATYGIAGYPKFNSPTEFVTDMGKLGCNLVNTASNHSFDKTQDAITASVNAWAAVPNTLAVAGENRNLAEHDIVHYFTVKNVKFAFISYTTYSNNDAPAQNAYGVNVFSQAFASNQIEAAKAAGAQVIIASMRWGTEYSTTVNAEQRADAQFLADQGVNLILGHGSHELQTVEQVTGKTGTKTTVWYSLGNFLNTQEPPETLFNGLAIIDFDTSTKQVTTMSYLPIYMHYEWTAAQAAADAITTRNNLHLYLLENATQAMLDSQQLHTSIAAQTTRITTTLNATLKIPLITSKQYYAQ